jgi:hypothetical protein
MQAEGERGDEEAEGRQHEKPRQLEAELKDFHCTSDSTPGTVFGDFPIRAVGAAADRSARQIACLRSGADVGRPPLLRSS